MMAGTTPKPAKKVSYNFARVKAKVRAKLRMMKIQGMLARYINTGRKRG